MCCHVESICGDHNATVIMQSVLLDTPPASIITIGTCCKNNHLFNETLLMALLRRMFTLLDDTEMLGA